MRISWLRPIGRSPLAHAFAEIDLTAGFYAIAPLKPCGQWPISVLQPDSHADRCLTCHHEVRTGRHKPVPLTEERNPLSRDVQTTIGLTVGPDADIKFTVSHRYPDDITLTIGETVAEIIFDPAVVEQLRDKAA